MLDSNNCDSNDVIKKICTVLYDKHIKGIILRIDSKGGDVIAAYDIYKEIVKLSNQKPVVLSLGNHCMSAAYWIASAGTFIYGNETTMLGAIGATMLLPNFANLLEKLNIGIENIILDVGSGNPFYGEITNENKFSIEEHLNFIREEFLLSIKRNRNMSDSLLNKIGQGQLITTEQALDYKMIDELGTMESSIDYLKSKYNLNNVIIQTTKSPKDSWIKRKIINMIINKLK